MVSILPMNSAKKRNLFKLVCQISVQEISKKSRATKVNESFLSMSVKRLLSEMLASTSVESMTGANIKNDRIEET